MADPGGAGGEAAGGGAAQVERRRRRSRSNSSSSSSSSSSSGSSSSGSSSSSSGSASSRSRSRSRSRSPGRTATARHRDRARARDRDRPRDRDRDRARPRDDYYRDRADWERERERERERQWHSHDEPQAQDFQPQLHHRRNRRRFTDSDYPPHAQPQQFPPGQAQHRDQQHRYGPRRGGGQFRRRQYEHDAPLRREAPLRDFPDRGRFARQEGGFADQLPPPPPHGFGHEHADQYGGPRDEEHEQHPFHHPQRRDFARREGDEGRFAAHPSYGAEPQGQHPARGSHHYPGPRHSHHEHPPYDEQQRQEPAHLHADLAYSRRPPPPAPHWSDERPPPHGRPADARPAESFAPGYRDEDIHPLDLYGGEARSSDRRTTDYPPPADSQGPSSARSHAASRSRPSLTSTDVTSPQAAAVPQPVIIPRDRRPGEWISGALRQFRVDDKIGVGTYGEVFKAWDGFANMFVALKRIKTENEKEGFPITALREVKILRQLKHENIVNLLGIVSDKDRPEEHVADLENDGEQQHSRDFYMVFEYMDHDLTGLLESGLVTLSANQIRNFMRQLMLALKYCHGMHILHRDLKGSNLLINNQGDLKIADFGLARKFEPAKQRPYTNKVITLWYRPPELLLGEEVYGPEIDIWSAACILGELHISKPLFRAENEFQQLEMIFAVCGSVPRDKWPLRVEMVSYYRNLTLWPRDRFTRNIAAPFANHPIDPLALDLLDKMLSVIPADRPSAEECLQHPYLVAECVREPLRLSRQQDCHEMWSKQQKRSRRQQASGSGSAAEHGAGGTNAAGAATHSTASAAAHSSHTAHSHHLTHQGGPDLPSSASVAQRFAAGQSERHWPAEHSHLQRNGHARGSSPPPPPPPSNFYGDYGARGAEGDVGLPHGRNAANNVPNPRQHYLPGAADHYSEAHRHEHFEVYDGHQQRPSASEAERYATQTHDAAATAYYDNIASQSSQGGKARSQDQHGQHLSATYAGHGYVHAQNAELGHTQHFSGHAESYAVASQSLRPNGAGFPQSHDFQSAGRQWMSSTGLQDYPGHQQDRDTLGHYG